MSDDATEPDQKAKGPSREDGSVSRQLCGWCNSQAPGGHDRCRDRNGYTPFSMGVHVGNQCKCHDLDHEYRVERPKPSSALRKKKR